MAVEVFCRYELKYPIRRDAYERVMREVALHMEPDSYSRDGSFYTISNLYYDTPDDELITIALKRGAQYRYKVRLRSYDPTRPTAFLEMKKKYNGLISKRRTTIMTEDVNPLLVDGTLPTRASYMNWQVMQELHAVGRSQTLVPKVIVSYDRQAFFGVAETERDLRVTFDLNVRTRRWDLDLRQGTHGDLLFPPDHVIMEVKVDRQVPLWLARLMSENGVYRRQFSKYAAEYKKYLTDETYRQKERQYHGNDYEPVPNRFGRECGDHAAGDCGDNCGSGHHGSCRSQAV